MTNPARRLAASWSRFLFEPEPTSTLAVFRIAFGLVSTLWVLSLAPHLTTFFGPNGVTPTGPPLGPGAWGLLSANSTTVLVTLWAATLIASLALLVGYRPQVAAVVLFIGIVSIERRNPLVVNSGDILLRNLSFLMIFAPSGAALSLDRWQRSAETFWTFPARSPWALRMMQVQLSVIYLSALWNKVQGDQWRSGTAVSYAMRIADIHRLPTPSFVSNSIVLTEVFTFSTMALELSLAILVWNRAARPWVLTLGVIMHLAIEFSVMVGFFSIMMLCLYLTFVPSETSSRYVCRMRDVLRARRRPGARWSGGAADEVSTSIPQRTASSTPLEESKRHS